MGYGPIPWEHKHQLWPWSMMCPLWTYISQPHGVQCMPFFLTMPWCKTLWWLPCLVHRSSILLFHHRPRTLLLSRYCLLIILSGIQLGPSLKEEVFTYLYSNPSFLHLCSGFGRLVVEKELKVWSVRHAFYCLWWNHEVVPGCMSGLMDTITLRSSRSRHMAYANNPQ